MNSIKNQSLKYVYTLSRLIVCLSVISASANAIKNPLDPDMDPTKIIKQAEKKGTEYERDLDRKCMDDVWQKICKFIKKIDKDVQKAIKDKDIKDITKSGEDWKRVGNKKGK